MNSNMNVTDASINGYKGKVGKEGKVPGRNTGKKYGKSGSRILTPQQMKDFRELDTKAVRAWGHDNKIGTQPGTFFECSRQDQLRQGRGLDYRAVDYRRGVAVKAVVRHLQAA